MKRLILLASFMMAGGFVYADMPSDGTLNFGVDSRTVVITSNTAAPTQILTHDAFVQRTWLINLSTFTVMISTFSHTFIAGSEVTIPGSTVFTPDGPQIPYWGQLFAVVSGTSNVANGNSISVLRTK